jgi:hypothetical protein
MKLEEVKTEETKATEINLDAGKPYPKMANIKQSAQFFNLSECYVRGLALKGEIKAVRSGVKIMVNMESLDEFLNNSYIKVEEVKNA